MQKKNKTIDFLVYSFAMTTFGFICMIVWTANNEVVALKEKEVFMKDMVIEIKSDVKEVRKDIKTLMMRSK